MYYIDIQVLSDTEKSHLEGITNSYWNYNILDKELVIRGAYDNLNSFINRYPDIKEIRYTELLQLLNKPKIYELW